MTWRALLSGVALLAVGGCEESTHPPFAPLSPIGGVIRTGGEPVPDAGPGARDGAAGDGGLTRPAWCIGISESSTPPTVIELGEVERAVDFAPAVVTAKWSGLFCKPGGRRFLRISLSADPTCDLWSAADPIQELFLYVDVDAIRAAELAPRGQPVGIEDDRVQVFFGGTDGRLWGICDAVAGGSIDFVSIGADPGDRIDLVVSVDLSDCAVEPTSFPLRVDAEIDVVLRHSEAEACTPAG